MSFKPAQSRSVANLFLISITGFGILSVAALAAARLEHLQPESTVLPPVVFAQLMGIHRILLKYFVLLPALTGVIGFAMLPKVCGRDRLAFPRLGLLSWALFTGGGLIVLWSSLGATLDPKWALYPGQQAGSQAGSLAFFIGLVLATLAIGLIAVNLMVSILTAKSNTSPALMSCLTGACVLQLMALPLVGSALLLNIGSGDGAGLFTLLATLAARPLRMSVLLAAIGVAAHLLAHGSMLSSRQVKRINVYVSALVVMALLAFETRFMPGTMSANALMAAAFFGVLMLLPLCALMFCLFGKHLRLTPSPTTPHLYAAAVALLVFLLAPLDVILSQPGMHALSGTFISSTMTYLLVIGSAMLALAGALHDLGVSNAQTGKAIALCVMLGLLAMVLPMIPLGLSGISIDFTTYPKHLQPLQVMSTYGGLILSIALIASLLHTSRHAVRGAHTA